MYYWMLFGIRRERYTYRGETEVAEGAYAGEGVIQKVGGLDVAVDDPTPVDIVKRPEEAPEVAFDALGVQCLEEVLNSE